MMILPMLASPLEIGDRPNQWGKIESTPYWMEPKLDGWRLMIHFVDGLGTIKAWTRQGRDISDRLPQGWVDSVWSLPYDTIVDCEFGYTSYTGSSQWPQIDFNQTARVLGSGGTIAQAKARQIGQIPIAHVFDMVQLRGKDLRTLTQAERRERIDEEVGIEGVMIKTQVAGSWNENTYLSYVKSGGEGVMLKNPEAIYKAGQRPPQSWYKIKKYDTLDVVILGFQMGRGKYQGQIGAIKFFDPVTGIEGKCSGMSDHDRLMFTKIQHVPVDSWMEIRYYGKTAGTPRHPQFVRLRPDK